MLSKKKELINLGLLWFTSRIYFPLSQHSSKLMGGGNYYSLNNHDKTRGFAI